MAIDESTITTRKRKDGRWESRITVGRDEDGNRIRISRYGKTRKESIKKIIKYLNEHNLQPQEARGMTFQELYELWMELYKKTELKPVSFDNVENVFVWYILNNIGFYDIVDITSDVIQIEIINKYAQEYGYWTNKKIYDQLHAVFEYAVNTKRIKQNPIDAIKAPSKKNYPEPEINVLDDAGIEILTQTTDNTYLNGNLKYNNGYAIVLILYTGLRTCELLGVKVKDIDFRKRVLHIRRNVVVIKNRNYDKNDPNSRKRIFLVQNQGKTKKSKRDIYLPFKAIELIEKIIDVLDLKPNDFLVQNTTGGHPYPKMLQYTLDRMLTDSGLEHYSLHELRHTYASSLIRKKIDIKVISKFMGHASVSFTYDTYVHIIEEQVYESLNELDEMWGA